MTQISSINRLVKLLSLWIFLIQLFPYQLGAQKQPISPLIYSFKKHQQLKNTSPYQLDWISLGPVVNSARVEAVQGVPSHPGTLYTAFGSGGLWKSTDNGLSWQVLFENMPSLGIGDFAIAPSNPDIIYIGTGESLKKARNFTMPGVGIYRSDNGGKDWSHLGLPDSWHIGELVVHPQNPDIVLVAVLGHFWSSNENRGIYRTTDGGKSWEHVLFINAQTGANDIVFSPADPSVVYATTWENHPTVHGAKSAVYKSEDGGKTWKKTINGITINQNTGRIGVAASYQNKNKAYVFVDQRNRGPEQGAGEVYRTDNGGASWTKTHEEPIQSLSVIGWYFMDIYLNPQDDNEIFGLGVRLIHSQDGGKTFTNIGGAITHLNPSKAQTLHLDHCELWINPLNPKELLLGNDGGLFHSYDKGTSWLHLNNIPTGEFYDISVDYQTPYQIYGGTQDDATVYGPAKEWNPSFKDRWQYLWIDAWSGGDGCITLLDPNDPNTLYFSLQNGAARRKDIQKGKSISIQPHFPEEDSIALQYNFITPYFLSPHNSQRVYMAGNYVMQSDDRGDHWKVISPNLIQAGEKAKGEIAAGAMAESPLVEGLLYVGTDRGTLWRSKNGGLDWENRSSSLPPFYIRSIHPSSHQKGRVYVQLSGINYDNLQAHLYVSEDFGNTWNSISKNLPNHPVNVILEDPLYENILYAGTYRGVYLSTNFGQDWAYLGKAMPDASIADLVIEPRSKDLLAATHGRGIYKMNLNPFYTYQESAPSRAYLFEPPAVKGPQTRDTHKDVDIKSLQKLPLTFWLPTAMPIELIVQKENSIVWKKAMAGKMGFNQFQWDLVTEEQSSNYPYFIHSKKYMKPGAYTLILQYKGGSEETTFTIHSPD